MSVSVIVEFPGARIERFRYYRNVEVMQPISGEG
jgi:hypothetical protein